MGDDKVVGKLIFGVIHDLHTAVSFGHLQWGLAVDEAVPERAAVVVGRTVEQQAVAEVVNLVESATVASVAGFEQVFVKADVAQAEVALGCDDEFLCHDKEWGCELYVAL